MRRASARRSVGVAAGPRRPARILRRGVRAVAVPVLVVAVGASAWLATAAAARQPAAPPTSGVTRGRPASDALAALKDLDDLDGRARRQVVVYPDRLELFHGDVFLGRLAFPGRRTTLPEIADVLARINLRDWARPLRPGEYLLGAALVQAPGTTLTIAAPEVRTVRLAGAYLAGLGARARLAGVTVTSWDPAAGAPERRPRPGRPFVLYGRGSRLDLAGAELAYLGSARAKGEAGVTWSLAGGQVTGSVFHHNHEGATLDRARPVTISGSVFRANAGNGLAAAGPGRGLTVTGSRAEGNGGSGLLVRRKTVRATLRGNHASGNAANGIVLETHADHATVDRNQVERNGEDGLVLRAAGHAALTGNTVTGNRVGVRLADRSGHNLLQHNRIHGNQVGVELYDGSHDTRLAGNQVTASARVGMVLEAPATGSRGDQVHGSPVGVEVRGQAALHALRVDRAGRGVVVTGQGTARLTAASIRAATVAVATEPGGHARVAGSALHAPTPLLGIPARGQAGNQLIEPPGPTTWLALAGLTCVILAIALQVLHRVRNGHAAQGRQALRSADAPPVDEDVRHASG